MVKTHTVYSNKYIGLYNLHSMPHDSSVSTHSKPRKNIKYIGIQFRRNFYSICRFCLDRSAASRDESWGWKN